MNRLKYFPSRRGLRREALNSFAALVFAVSILAGIDLHADDFSLRSYPLPVNVDTSLVRSKLYLQFETKDYNLSVEELAKKNLSPEEALFVRTAQTIHDKDSVALAGIWGDPRPRKKSPGASMVLSEITPKQVVAEYAADFVDLQKPRLVDEVLVGNVTLFVWETSSDGTPTRFGFQVIADDKNKLLIKDIDSVQDPISNLIVLTMNEVLRHPAEYRNVESAGTKFRYAFPLAGKGNPGKHAVTLQFSGEPLDFPVYDERVQPPTPLLTFYRTTYSAFRAKKYDEFIQAYTTESQRKLKEFIPTLSGSIGPQTIDRMTANKYVKFVVNADPIYLVFYSGFPGTDWPPGSLGYDYVYNDPVSARYLLTNFFVQGFLDGIFRDTGLFNELIFKPALKAGPSKLQKGK